MSAVFQVDEGGIFREHVARLRAMERAGALWIVVGTIGIDGVDDLITPDSPRFNNNWTQAGGGLDAFAFCLFDGWVHFRGAVANGADGTSIVTLPVGFRPKAQSGPHVIGTALVNHYSTYYVLPSGDVMFGTVV